MLYYAIVAVIALIFDQLIKYWTIVNVVENTGEKALIPGFIHLANVHNTGAAFSFLQGARWFFVVLCILFVAVVIYLMLRETIKSPGARWSAVIVMTGAIGNAIDRVINTVPDVNGSVGYVVDMFEFEFKIFGRAFPVFNLADIYITLGAIAFCIFILTEKPEDAAAAAQDTRASGGRKRKKTEIPTFPKREPQPEPPPMDPADPFAEWERLAAQEDTSARTPEQNAPARTGTVTYTQPAAAEKQLRMELPSKPQPEPPAAQAAPAPDASPTDAAEPMTNTERVMRILVQGRPAEETPAAVPPPAAPEPSKPAPGPVGEEISYDLEDILAEFRDL